MRNDVKLGLAVGGLLLGVVLAYALFFSNNSGERDKDALASGRFGTVENGGSAEASRQQGSGPVEAITDLSAPGNVGNNTGTTAGNIGQEMPPVTETSTPEATADAGTNTNVITGRSWTELLNSGGTGTVGPVLPPRENIIGSTATVRSNTLSQERDPAAIIDPPAVSGPRRYIIKNGDSFWSIARAEYGNAGYFAHIVRANPQVDPGKLKPGMAIVLPDKSEVIAAATPRQDVAETSRSAPEQVLDQSTQYKVRSGDSLSVIAKKLYGRYDKWVSIYELNRELIGPNPGILKNGMILRLPEPPARLAGSL